MRVGLLTVCRLDMLEHFKVAKESGIDIDILIPENADALRRGYISACGLPERTYSSEDNLLDILGEYDVTSAYEFGGPIRKKIMERYDNFVPECAWNIPSYGTGFGSDDMYLKCLKLAKTKVKSFIARSQSVHDCLIQEGIPKEKIHLVWGVCDTNRFKPRPKPERFKDKLVFLSIARQTGQKGIFEVFHSFHRANIPNSLLVLIGPPHPSNPWDYNLVRKWAKILEIEDKVIFHGEVPCTEVHKYFNWGDVFITLPNTDVRFVEQVGLTVPQAMASGLPVITYDYGGQAGFVDSSCGIKIPHKDYAAGARAMIAVADKNVRERMGVAANAIAVMEYDVHSYAIGIKVAYEEGMK